MKNMKKNRCYKFRPSVLFESFKSFLKNNDSNLKLKLKLVILFGFFIIFIGSLYYTTLKTFNYIKIKTWKISI